MKYTIQYCSESGSFACPENDDVEHVKGLNGIRACLDYWTEQHDMVGSDSSLASLWVVYGFKDNLDYPDFIVSVGPCGGLRRLNA